MVKKLIKAILLVKAFKSVKSLVPKTFKKNIRTWIDSDKYRAFVSVNELRPQLEKSLLFLSDKVGTDAFGDYLEFGVSHGTSLNCMYQTTNDLGYKQIRLFGFDSFEGMPEEAETQDEGTWYKGQFKCEIEKTKRYLTSNGVDWKRTYLTKGWFSDTLTDELKQKYKIRKASVIMIDCDIYSAAKEALQFSAPLIKDTTIIIFDDWGSNNLDQKNLGEKRAFNEFLIEYPYLKAEEFGSYTFNGKPNGKLFVVTNTKAFGE